MLAEKIDKYYLVTHCVGYTTYSYTTNGSEETSYRVSPGVARAAPDDQEPDTPKRRPDRESWEDMTARFGDTWT